MLCRQERPLPNLDPSGGRCSLLLYYTSSTLSPDILGFKQHNTKQFVLSSIMWKMWILVHILLCCHLASRSIIATEIVHMVHWNQSNPLFFDSPDSRIDIQNSGKWNLYEQANIICPFYDTSVPLSLTEQWVIYNVTKNIFKWFKNVNWHWMNIVKKNMMSTAYNVTHYICFVQSFLYWDIDKLFQ